MILNTTIIKQQTMNTASFLHSGSIGDVWASLPAIRECYRKTGKKAILYLEKDCPAFYYDGATHPTRDASNEMVMLNEKMIGMMMPLLKAQEFIEDAKLWEGEEINPPQFMRFVENKDINRLGFYIDA